MKTRKNNKGFSLVELIVVVAIMAVLVGVLAPAYLRYVEKSRYQKDISAVNEVEQAIKVAVADETIFDDLTAGQNYTVTIAKDTPAAPTCSSVSSLQDELSKTVGTVTLSSKTITSDISITFSVSASGVVTISNNAPSYS